MYPNQAKFDELRLVGSRRSPSIQRAGRPLHRIAEVMKQEQVTLRTVARRLGTSEWRVRAELQPTSDLTLSKLYRWQAAMDVPAIDLLVEPGLALSRPVQQRSGLLKAMRTARSLVERAETDSVRLLAARLVQQLTDVMPELSEVRSWPAVGPRRTLDDLGAIAERPISDEFLDSNLGEE